MDASIILPIYKPNKEILNKVLNSLNKQKFSGKFEILQIDEQAGFAEQMNRGIKRAKYPIVIMLPQDCIPSDSMWLEKLVEPFKDSKVIASVSSVKFPDELWDSLSTLAKALLIKEKGTITSLLDGKGGAYRKSALKKIGLFDNKTFKSAGEDFDTYLKFKEMGKIAYPGALIIHMHPSSFRNRLRKNYQYANAYGALTRVHGRKMHRWYVGIIHSIPIVGIFSYILSYPFTKGLSLFFPFIIASICNHPYYVLGFWKGFLMGKQTV